MNTAKGPLQKHPLIKYIFGHTRVLEPSHEQARHPVIDLRDKVIVLKNDPQPEDLRRLIELNQMFTAAAAPNYEPTQQKFNPLSGSQHDCSDIGPWLQGLHDDWRNALPKKLKKHRDANPMQPRAMKMLALRFMAVAHGVGLVKLKTPEVLAGLQESMDHEGIELGRLRIKLGREIPATEFESDPRVTDLLRRENDLTTRYEDYPAYLKVLRTRGFYAITTADLAKLRETLEKIITERKPPAPASP